MIDHGNTRALQRESGNFIEQEPKHNRHKQLLHCRLHITKRPLMRRSSRLALRAFLMLSAGTVAQAQTVYPVDRAQILVGSRFDFKVELPERMAQSDIRVTVNGQDYAAVFGKPAAYIEKEDGKEESSLLLRDVVLGKAGDYAIKVSAGARTRDLSWTVYETGPRKAKNVILFIGDGLSPAHRAAARILSKGIAEGRSLGKLAIDDMPHMALVATAGTDSIITDSANGASAFATGHKSAVNAMGVYADRSKDEFDDPKVETISSLVKGKLNMAVGVVTNTEIEDATPAAMIAHTRRRAAYDQIVEQYFNARPDVLLGGGSANFLPKSAAGSKRKDETDYIAKFKEAGYTFASTAAEMKAAIGATRLLGLFNTGNMDGILDRKILKAGSVKKFPDQPDLTEQVDVALEILSRNQNGFFLMVESGMIDKYAHLLDMERAVYDTIMLDNAVARTKQWAAKHGDDTLILVVADHGHPSSLVGTIDDDMASTPNVPMRERVKVYDKAGFPNYPKADAEGYPAKVDVSRRLAMFSASLPDHYETFRPKLDDPYAPTRGVKGTDNVEAFEANEKYKDVPGAVLRLGNISKYVNASVHSGEDVLLTATGPGSERVRGQIDNTEVFRVMVEALGLGQANRTTGAASQNGAK
jgi:alkaline phosphatase